MIPAPKRRRATLLYVLLTVPFLANDLANIYVHDPAVWLGIDYGVKALVLAAMAVCLRKGLLAGADLGLRPLPVGSFMTHLLVLAALGTALDQYAYGPLTGLIPGTRLGHIPEATGVLFWFDLFAGLALVALVEELVFRGLALSAVSGPDKSGRTWSRGAQLAVTGLVFGLIHWSSGIPAVIITGAIGTLFMLSVLRTGSVWPPMAAHFVVNFVDFSGILAT